MRSTSLCFILALAAAVSGADASQAQLCRPQLSFKQVGLSEVQNQKRKWTARLAIDASRCASASGRFEINIVREKENALELEFQQWFTWHTGELQTGQIEVSIEFWQDEAVLDYSFGLIPPCACRG